MKIATPFGGMSVKTDDANIVQSTGMPTYPGAILVTKKDKDDHHDGSADINMSFGSFQLRVKAVSFHTTDSPEKVTGVLQEGSRPIRHRDSVQGPSSVGSPTRTPDGLDCSDDDSHRTR